MKFHPKIFVSAVPLAENPGADMAPVLGIVLIHDWSSSPSDTFAIRNLSILNSFIPIENATLDFNDYQAEHIQQTASHPLCVHL